MTTTSTAPLRLVQPLSLAPISTSATSPVSNDLNNVNYVVPEGSHLRDKVRATSLQSTETAQPVPVVNTTKIAPKNVIASNTISALTVNSPLAPAAHAAINNVPATQPTQTAPVTAPTAAVTPQPQAAAKTDTTNGATSDNNQPAPPVSNANTNNSNDSSSQSQPPQTAAPQTTIAQTNFYSSIASSNASTIRGTGVNVVS